LARSHRAPDPGECLARPVLGDLKRRQQGFWRRTTTLGNARRGTGAVAGVGRRARGDGCAGSDLWSSARATVC